MIVEVYGETAGGYGLVAKATTESVAALPMGAEVVYHDDSRKSPGYPAEVRTGVITRKKIDTTRQPVVMTVLLDSIMTCTEDTCPLCKQRKPIKK